MYRIRKANERGHANYGWLDTYHTFSFADYYDPEHRRFRSLRVINEDRVSPGQGFGTHPHADMEIVTYVLEGELEHRDSMGNGEVLAAGELQRMSAGTGITHSEFNPSKTTPVHLYQIWLLPERKGIEPSYEQKRFDPQGRINSWQLVASQHPEHGAMKIHQDVDLYLADLEAKQSLQFSIKNGRHLWLQVLRGSISAHGQLLQAGDGLSVSEEVQLDLLAESHSELLLFDLA